MAGLLKPDLADTLLVPGDAPVESIQAGDDRLDLAARLDLLGMQQPEPIQDLQLEIDLAHSLPPFSPSRLRRMMANAAPANPEMRFDSIRYGVVEDQDVIEAGAKLDQIFQGVVANRNGNRNHAGHQESCQSTGPNAEMLAKLSAVPEEKLKAVIALLGL